MRHCLNCNPQKVLVGDQKLNFLRTIAVICGLVLSASVQAAFASDLGTIAMTVDDSDKMTIHIQLNERSGLGILDTAATYMLIDADLLTDTNSTLREEKIAIMGLSGPRIFSTAQIGPVIAGEIDLQDMPAAINAQARFPGHKTILPASAFNARVIDFDFLRNRIDIYDTKPKSNGDVILSKFRYQEIQGLPFIKVKLNGKPGLALIDTGSDATYINSKFADIAGARLQPDKTISLIGSDNDGTRVRVMSAKSLKIGRHSMRDFRILSADPPLFKHLGLEDQPVMVLGLDTLRNFRLQIDRKRQQILLGRPETRQEGRRFRVQPFSSRLRPRNID